MFRVDKNAVKPEPLRLPLLFEELSASPEETGDFPRDAAPAPAEDYAVPAITRADAELRDARERVELELAAARTSAEEIVAKAQSDADALRAAAEAEIADARAEETQHGYDAGYADGYNSGASAAADDAKIALENKFSELDETNKEALGSLLSSVTRELTAAREELSGAALPLIMDIAEKILGGALADDDNVIAMINAAVSGLSAGERLAVRLPSQTAERLFSRGSVTVRVQGRDVTAEVVPDETLSDYGLVIEFGTDGGTVSADAGLSTQLNSIRNALSKAEDNPDA